MSIRIFTARALAMCVIAALMILALAQAAAAGEWPMRRHDIIYSGTCETPQKVASPLSPLHPAFFI